MPSHLFPVSIFLRWELQVSHSKPLHAGQQWNRDLPQAKETILRLRRDIDKEPTVAALVVLRIALPDPPALDWRIPSDSAIREHHDLLAPHLKAIPSFCLTASDPDSVWPLPPPRFSLHPIPTNPSRTSSTTLCVLSGNTLVLTPTVQEFVAKCSQKFLWLLAFTAVLRHIVTALDSNLKPKARLHAFGSPQPLPGIWIPDCYPTSPY